MIIKKHTRSLYTVYFDDKSKGIFFLFFNVDKKIIIKSYKSLDFLADTLTQNIDINIARHGDYYY